MTIQKAALLALLFFLSGVSFAADCYLVNGQHVCVNRIGVPSVKTLGDIQREQAQAAQQQQLIDNQLLLQQLEIMRRVKPMLEQEQQQRNTIIKNAFMQLSSAEQQKVSAYMTSLPEDSRTKIGNIVVNMPAENRVQFLQILAALPPEHKAQFAAELSK